MPDLNMNVLHVEDDEIDRKAVQRAFREHGIACAITEARDGKEAMEFLRGEHDKKPPTRPFLILLDINMPRMNGLEFLAELRADTNDPSIRNAVVFILTTSAAEQDRASAYDKFVAGYMVKSDYVEGMSKMVEMLAAYGHVVEFP